MAEGLPYLNKVFIIGNLVRDPVLSYTPSGTAVCRMSVAINRRYKSGSGEWQEDVVFIDLIVWGRQGENSQKYLSKGKKVFIEGRLSQNRWTAPDGTPRNKIEIVAERVQFLSAPDSRTKTEITSEETPEKVESEEQVEEAFSDDVPF